MGLIPNIFTSKIRKLVHEKIFRIKVVQNEKIAQLLTPQT